MTLWLRDDIANAWQGKAPFAQAAQQNGDVFRAREGRRTLRFTANNQSYFLKYHAGIGWKEIIKNLLQFKLPVLSAMNEVRAINAITQAGISTMTIAGYGHRGSNPAAIESFIITDDLTDTLSLEDAAIVWQGKPPKETKRKFIIRLGNIARQMHQAGVNHRDFYLCHFLIKKTEFAANNTDAPLYLIDLHRSQVRKQVPKRWVIKDLGGLYFSMAPWALTRADLLLFVGAYTGKRPLIALRENLSFWRAVQHEGERLYQRAYDEAPKLPLGYQPPFEEDE